MEKKLIEKLLSLLVSDDTKNINTSELGSIHIGKYVILRGYDSGVHFWKLEFAWKWLYRLSDSRRLWRWWANESISLSGVATYGLANKTDVKICPMIPLIEITDDRISEIIPCTDVAIKSIKNYKESIQD